VAVSTRNIISWESVSAEIVMNRMRDKFNIATLQIVHNMLLTLNDLSFKIVPLEIPLIFPRDLRAHFPMNCVSHSRFQDFFDILNVYNTSSFPIW